MSSFDLPPIPQDINDVTLKNFLSELLATLGNFAVTVNLEPAVVITSGSGDIQIPSWCNAVEVDGCAPGGAGGGSNSGGTGSGAGGAGGETARGFKIKVTPGSTLAYSIGNFGVGALDTNGTSATDTTIGTLTLKGGAGGTRRNGTGGRGGGRLQVATAGAEAVSEGPYAISGGNGANGNASPASKAGDGGGCGNLAGGVGSTGDGTVACGGGGGASGFARGGNGGAVSGGNGSDGEDRYAPDWGAGGGGSTSGNGGTPANRRGGHGGPSILIVRFLS